MTNILDVAEEKEKRRKKNKRGPKNAPAVLSNMLFIRKSVLKDPQILRDNFEYEIDISGSAQSRIAREQINWIRKAIEEDGFDAEDVLAEYDESRKLIIRNWKDVGKWWAVCAGDRRKIKKLVKKLGVEVRDKRVDRPLDIKGLKMLVPLREEQVEPARRWAKKGYGILKAAPAFGKTVVAINNIIELNQQTLVLVHTDALAKQFIDRFRKGFKKDDKWVRITNCKKIEKRLGRKIIGRYKPKAPFYPITVATYQAFIQSDKTWEKFKILQENFGLVICDEAHRAAAPTYSRVINACQAKYRQGITATPSRKDEMEFGIYDILGPVTAVGDAKQLPIEAYMHQTGYVHRAGRYPGMGDWSRMINKLLESNQRNQYILNWLKKDVEEGRNVLILSDRVQWCQKMAKYISREMGIPAGVATGGAGKAAKDKRDRVIAKMVAGEIKVIVATKVMDEGVDVPPLDTLYITCPGNNKQVLEQRLGRVRRHYEGKMPPIVRYFVDEGHGALYGCAKGTQKSLMELGVPIHYVSKRKSDKKVEKAKTKRSISSFQQATEARKGKVGSLFEDAVEMENQFAHYKRRAMGKKK